MALLQNDKAIFYHPLDDAVEQLKTKTWTGTANTTGGGKIGQAMSRVDISASLAGTSVDYDSAAAATKVAFCGWFREPSVAPAQTAAPTTDSPIGDADTSASGTGVNGATVEVFVDDATVGDADGVVAGGVWSKTGMAALSTGEVVSAKQRSTGETQSIESNEVTVQAFSAAPTTDSPIAVGATSVSGTGVNGSTIEVFVDDISVGAADAVVAGGVWSKTGMTALSDGEVVSAKQTESGKLQSAESNEVTVSTIFGFGSKAKFNAGISSNTGISALSATKVVVVWRDESDSNHGKAKVGTVSGTDVTFGAENKFDASNTLFMAVTALSATKCVVVHRSGADGHGKAHVGTVSGTDITFGATGEFHNDGGSGPFQIFITTLSSTKIVVSYQDLTDSSHGTAKVGTVSGTDITFGAETEFLSTGSADDPALAALSATKFVVTYRDNVDSGHGTAKVGTVTGTAIAFGAETEFLSAGGAFDISVAALSSTVFVVGYADQADLQHGTANVGTVSGTTITFGAENEFGAGDGRIGVAALSATEFVVVYRDNLDSNHGTARVGTVSGTTMTFGAEAEFLSVNGMDLPFVTALDSALIPPASASAFVVAYQDESDSSHGAANVGTV